MWLVETPKNHFPLVQSLKNILKQPGNGSFRRVYSKARYLRAVFSLLFTFRHVWFFFWFINTLLFSYGDFIYPVSLLKWDYMHYLYLSFVDERITLPSTMTLHNPIHTK